MTETRAKQVEWLLLAMAVLALGLTGGYAESAKWLATLRSLVADPVTGTLVLICAALATRPLNYQVAPLVCAFAGCAWIAAALIEVLQASGSTLTAQEITVACIAFLACATLADQLFSTKRPGRAVAATLYSVAIVGCVISVIALLLTHSEDDPTSAVIPALGASVSFVGLWQLLRRYSASMLPELLGPMATAGILGTLFVWPLIAHHAALSTPEQLAWMATACALLLMLTLTGMAIVRLAAEVLAVRRSGSKWKRLLGRQRSIMQTRTAALRQSEAHYGELFANVPAPVLLTHPSGTVIAANPAMLELLGLHSEEEIKGSNFAAFYADPEERRKLVADWTASDKVIHQGEVTLRRADGEPRSVLFTSRVVRAPRTGDIDYFQGTCTDITELRRAEAAHRKLEGHLRLSQKLESVGRLAAGIAHEINTPMQYIGDNVYYLKEAFGSVLELLEKQRRAIADVAKSGADDLANTLRKLESEADLDDVLQAVPGALSRSEEGIKTVTRIVAAMKELAHPGDGAKASTDVNALIGTAITVTRNAHKTVATMEVDLAEVPNALTYKNELCQVFINLIVNAAHAIETAQATDHRAGVISIRTTADAEWLHVEISDNGCGIPESVRDKIFDPFFTTKEVGRGTGQGLALARATIVDKHHGRIDVHSVVGHGSTFTISLPLINNDSYSDPEMT